MSGPTSASLTRRTAHIIFRPIVIAVSLLVVCGCARSDNHAFSVDPLVVLANTYRGYSLGQQRALMVERIRNDLRSAAPSADTPAFEKALKVIGTIPREDFVRKSGRKAAYVLWPQEIGYGQTISDPYVVAIMTGALDLSPEAEVLDVGTGSGYQAAILARVARHVSSIEIVGALAITASRRLHRLGFSNVEVRTGDGFLGWPKHAPFDGIVVAANAPSVPPPLLDQLKQGGRLIMPIGPSENSTQLLRITKRTDGSLERCSLGDTSFVPLVSTHTSHLDRHGLFDRSIPLCFGTPIVWQL